MERSHCLWLALLLSGCGAAKYQGPSAERDTQTPARQEPEGYPDALSRNEIPIVLNGKVDIFNRYTSTVKVSADVVIPAEGRDEMACSGFLVDPRVVITAGHCVCAPRRRRKTEGQTIIDDPKSQCARTAEVSLLSYQRRDGLEGAVTKRSDVIAKWSDPYTGTVEVHEDIRILRQRSVIRSGSGVKAVNNTVESNADIAVIVLKVPVKEILDDAGYASLPLDGVGEEPINLAVGDEVTVVGVGAAGGLMGVGGGTAGDRRFGSNNILSLGEDGKLFVIGQNVMLEQSFDGERPSSHERKVAAYAIPGDSGGPCYVNRNGKEKVVGIAKTYFVDEKGFVFSTYTNAIYYLGWLRNKIDSAKIQPVD